MNVSTHRLLTLIKRKVGGFLRSEKILRNFEKHPDFLTMFSARRFQPRKESSKSNISEHEKRPPTRCKRSLLI